MNRDHFLNKKILRRHLKMVVKIIEVMEDSSWEKNIGFEK